MRISKIISLLCIISILSGLSPVFAEDTQTDFNATATHVNALQIVNPTLPTSVSQQRGRVGEIMSKLFDNQGRIGNWYIKAFRNVENNAIMRWSGGKNGTFATGSLYDTGTKVGIGDSTPSFDLDVTGDINFTGNFYNNGSLVNFAGKWINGTNPLNASYMTGNVGIKTLTPGESLSVVGRISSTLDPNSDDDIGDRGYNDARYLAISGTASDSNLLDGIDSTAFVRTTTNQTIAGTKTFSSTIGGSINGNAGTATALQTARNIALTGPITGTASFNGTANIAIATTLANDAVTSAKILNGTITTDDIATDTIAAVDIAADSIGASELANNSVAAANIIDGSIVNADVNASAAIAGTKISPDFGSQNIITTGNVGIGALSPSSALQIDDASITSGNKSFRIYGYDIGASTAKYGALSVDGAGNFTVSAEDTYLLLNAANYIQSNKPHNFTSSVLFGGDTNLFRSAANTLRTNDAFIVDGNVGIGTTSPTDKLTIVSGAGPAINITTSGDYGMYIGSPDNNEGVIGFGADFAQSGGAVTSYTAKDTSAGVMRVDNGALYYYADTGLTAGNSFTPTQRFLVEANGNTTIGGTLSVAGGINGDDITDGTIDSSEIEDGTITSTDILDNTVAAIDIAADSIGASELANDSVASANIIDATITADDLGAASVGTSEIIDNSIAAIDIAPDSIGASELANNSVAAANIINGSIVDADVNASAAIAGTKISPNFGAQNILTTGNGTFGGNVTGINLNVTATNTAGAPGRTTAINLTGYEGRGKGIFINDTSNSDEWFIGEGYDYNGIGIGLDSVGSQSEYLANAKLRIDTSGNLAIGGTLDGDSITDGTIDSTEIENGSIVNADVNASAAIAGTKIAPNFGAQNILTTGTIGGVGSGLTGLNASNLSTGTVPDARLSGNVVMTSGNQTIAGTKTFSSTISGNISGNAGTATALQTARNIAGVSFNGTANIAIPFANLSSKPTTIAGYGITDGVTTSGNQTIAGTKTFSSPVVGATPTSANHLTTKDYVDTLVTQGVTWKGPVESGNTVVGTWGACNGTRESWTTYNKNDDIIYICDGSNWISIGSSASVPYATTSSAGKIQIAGDIQGTWNNITIKDGVVDSAAIANDTITETDISNSFVARDSNLLDGIDSSAFVQTSGNQTIAGIKTFSQDNTIFNSNTNTDKVYFTRLGSTVNEYLSIGTDDTYTYFERVNDENVARIRFSLSATDTESGGGVGANNGNIDFTTDATGRNISIDGNNVLTTASSIPWGSITTTPTTVAGYGITDAVTTSGNQTIAGTKTFSSTIAGSINGNAGTATALQTARNIAVSGDVTGTASFNGTANISIASTIANDAITSAKIAPNTIVAADIAANAIGNSELASNAVQSVNIANGTVTGADILDNTIAAIDIAPDAIGASELANNSVAAANIINGSIVNADVNASAAIAGMKISPDFGSQSITTSGNISTTDGFVSIGNPTGIAKLILNDGRNALTGEISQRSDGRITISPETGVYTNSVEIMPSGNMIVQGTISGNGSGLTNLNASDLSTGTVPDARLSGNVVMTSGNQTIAGTKTFSSTISGNISGNAGTATALQTARNIAGVSFNGTANIAIPFANLSSKPTTIAGYGITDGVTTSGNQTIAGTKTFSSPVVGAEPTASSHLTTKNYVDTLVTQGVTWKGPIASGQTIVGTWGACDAAKQSWTTYNKNDDIIYICDGSSWISIGSSASVPYATTGSAGKIQIAGDIQGTWNNITIKNDAITSAKIAANTIVAGDIAANAIGNSELASNAVQSVNIANGTIVDADVNASAAIAGTKISPNFGAQNITTTGNANINEIQFANLEPTNLTVDGNVGFDSSRGLIIYRTQEVGQETGDGTYTVLDTSNITGGSGINITNTTANISGTEAITFSVDDGPGSGLDADTLDGIDSVNFLRSNTADTFNGTLTAGNYGVGNQIFSFGSANKGVKYITDQEGISIGTDSSMLLHAGDNVDTLTSELGIVAGTTSENLYLTADSNVDIRTNRQGGNFASTYLFRFGTDGVTSLPGNLTLGGTLGGDSITDNTIDSSEIQNGTLTSTDILDNTIAAVDIAANAIGNSELASNAVQSVNIANGTIVDADIAADTITAGSLAANSVGDSELIDAPTFTTPTLSSGAPILNFTETDQTDPAGRWRLVADGGNFSFRKRAAAGTWAGEIYPLQILSNGTVSVATITGNGSGLTNLNASNLSSGTVPDARLSGNVVLTSGNQTIAGTKTFSSTIAGSINGNAGTATALQTARNIAVSGDVTGTASFNGTANISIASTIANDAITSAKIAPNTIVAADIAANAIGNSELASNAVQSVNIANGTVTGADILDNTIAAIDIAPDSIGASELANNSVAAANIINGSIVDADVNASAAIAGTKISPNFGSQTIQTTGVTDISQNTHIGKWHYILDYANNGTPTNGYKIKTNLPYTNGMQMPLVKVQGYMYGAQAPIDINISWYVYNGNFSSYGASSSGKYAPTIQLANEGGKVVIYLQGGVYYSRFNIQAYENMGTNDAMFEGWSVVDEVITGTDTVTVAYNNSFGSIIASGTITGNGSGLTNLNASNLSTGTIPAARLPNTVVLTSGNQTIGGTKTFSSTISGNISGNAGTATALQTARTIAGVSFNGTANIAIPFANLSSKPTTISGYGITDGVTTSGNQTIAGTKTFSSPVVGAEPTASSHLTTKNYVDTLVTQGVTWKGPVESGNSVVGTWGACDAAKQSWTTYNKNDDIIYICDGSSWISIGSSASVPYATTGSAGKIQIAGDIQGTWNNITIKNDAITSAKIAANTIVAADIGANAIGNSELASNAVQSVNIANGTVTGADILNNTIDETEISDSFVARNSQLLDSLDSTQFIRSDADDTITGKIAVGNTANRRSGMYGIYDSTKIGHIWSMGTAYQIPQDGSNFGNLYGLAYKHTNNPTGGTMAGGHQMVWTQNGTPYSAMGANIWTAGTFIGNGSTLTNLNASNLSSGTVPDARLSGNVVLTSGNQTIAGTKTFSSTIAGSINGNAGTATALQTARNIAVSGDVTGSASFNGTSNISISSTIANDAITSAKIAPNTIVAADIGANAIGNSELASNAVQSVNIADGTVTGADILNNTIDETEISDAFVARDADKLDNLDSTDFSRFSGYKTATAASGWVTVAESSGSRGFGEVYVWDTDSGDHAFMHLSFMRSYADASANVLNTGGHARRITGARVIRDSDTTYGLKRLQVYVTASSAYRVLIKDKDQLSGFNGTIDTVTPVLENLPVGWVVQGSEITDLTGAGGAIATTGNMKIAGNDVLTSASAINGDNITDNTIDSSEIQNGTLTSTDILDNTIAAIDIAPNAIGNSELASNAVQSVNIANGTIVSADIATDTITAGNLAANSVGDSELIDNPTVSNLSFAAVNGNGPRFWGSDSYKIYMSSIGDATWGGRLDATSDYNMYFRMTAGTNRGFVFRNNVTNVAQIDGAGNIYANGSFYYGDNKEIIDFNDTWLRLNQNNDFTSGVYTPGIIRSDAGLYVGDDESFSRVAEDVIGTTDNFEVTGYITATQKVVAGEGVGSVAMTINDGGGNANLTFNHVAKTPGQNGNSARIEVNVDATSNASMSFELASNVTSGVAVDATSAMRLYEDGDIQLGGTSNMIDNVTCIGNCF